MGQFWTPITPESGSILHADSQSRVLMTLAASWENSNVSAAGRHAHVPEFSVDMLLLRNN